MTKNSALVQGYFNRHKDVNELFFVGTMPFFKETDAVSHARSMKTDVEIVRVTREEAFAEAAESDLNPFSKEVTDKLNQAADAAKNANNGGAPVVVLPKEETFDHEVTQEDLDNNPDLVTQGVKVGDTIQIPKKPTAEETELREAQAAVDALKQFTAKEVKAAARERLAKAQAAWDALTQPAS